MAEKVLAADGERVEAYRYCAGGDVYIPSATDLLAELVPNGFNLACSFTACPDVVYLLHKAESDVIEIHATLLLWS